MIRRNKLQIMKEILKILAGRKKSGLSKTRFKQLTGLSPQAFKDYYNILKDSKLISENHYSKKHKLTNKKCTKPITKIFLTQSGEDYLKRFRTLLSKINKLNEEYKINFDKITN